MGAVGVWILEHGKMLAAWATRLTAWGILVGVFVTLGVYSKIGELLGSTAASVARVATMLPRAVSTYNGAISDIAAESDCVKFLLWLFNIRALNSMISMVVVDITALFGMLAFVVTICTGVISAVWVYRAAQRFTNVLAGGKLNGSNPTD